MEPTKKQALGCVRWEAAYIRGERSVARCVADVEVIYELETRALSRAEI
ncbi:MAG: hypothetical protein GY944_06055 [bacterium]|nr:hypothetical protein [bacterium]